MIAAGAALFGTIVGQIGPWFERRLKRETRWDDERLEAYVDFISRTDTYIRAILHLAKTGTSPSYTHEEMTKATTAMSEALESLRWATDKVLLLGPDNVRILVGPALRPITNNLSELLAAHSDWHSKLRMDPTGPSEPNPLEAAVEECTRNIDDLAGKFAAALGTNEFRYVDRTKVGRRPTSFIK